MSIPLIMVMVSQVFAYTQSRQLLIFIIYSSLYLDSSIKLLINLKEEKRHCSGLMRYCSNKNVSVPKDLTF